MQHVSLIIPTYNEARNIPVLIPEIFSYIDKNDINLEIIIIDDGSPDGTAQVARDLAKNYPIRVIERSEKLGLGSAVRVGFAASDRLLLGVMDGDLSHDPVILPELINALLKYDIAIGSRFEKNSSVENWTWFRKSLSHVGVFLARILTQTHDPLSGYFFLKRSVIESTKLDTRGYKILLEILVKGVYKQVKEIPFRFRIRRFSASKLSWHEHILFLQQLLSYAWYKVGKRCKV